MSGTPRSGGPTGSRRTITARPTTSPGWSGRSPRPCARLKNAAAGERITPKGLSRCRSADIRCRATFEPSELGQLCVGRHDPPTARTEIHDQGGVNLDVDHPAEAVPVVGNLIPHGELLDRRSGWWGAERASGQVAPGRGAGCFHHYQYAPARQYVCARPLSTGQLGGLAPLRNGRPPGWPDTMHR